MKNLFIFFTLVYLLVFFSKPVFAESNYVLPYPSFMPEDKLYKINLVWEKLSKHWYFGDFGKFNYNLKMADKYLVEAKTLFEYKQYLLGYEALEKSNFYFTNILPSIAKAEKRIKDVTQKRAILRGVSRKHIEVLKEMERDTPDAFLWQPEKTSSTTLHLKKSLTNSIYLREKNL